MVATGSNFTTAEHTMDICTVVCFENQQVAAFQFAEACVKSKMCPTFQKHAETVLANLDGFDSWDAVIDRFNELRAVKEARQTSTLRAQVFQARNHTRTRKCEWSIASPICRG